MSTPRLVRNTTNSDELSEIRNVVKQHPYLRGRLLSLQEDYRTLHPIKWFGIFDLEEFLKVHGFEDAKFDKLCDMIVTS